MADRIVVMRDGIVEQTGAPLDLYDTPANTFVAGFIGSPAMNMLPGVVRREGANASVTLGAGTTLPVQGAPDAGREVLYGIRPEHLSLAAPGSGITGEVVVVEPTGADTQVVCRAGGQDVIAVIKDRVACRAGERIGLAPDPSKAHVFDRASGARLAA